MFPDCPSPPSGVIKVSKVTPTSCQLDWDAPADDGGSPVTSYMVERRCCGSEGDVEGAGQWQTIGRSYVRHMVAWELVAGQQYQFRVSAENMYGISVTGHESDVVIASGAVDQDASSEMNYDSLGAFSADAVCDSVNLNFNSRMFVKAKFHCASWFGACLELVWSWFGGGSNQIA